MSYVHRQTKSTNLNKQMPNNYVSTASSLYTGWFVGVS